MFYPALRRKNAQQVVSNEFRGINRAERINDGEFARARNLSTREYPMLCPRKSRGTGAPLSQHGAMLAPEQRCWVAGSRV